MTTEELYARLPQPKRIQCGGFAPGEKPYIALVYELGEHDEALEELLGEVFGQARDASTDGTIKVVVE